MRNKILTAAIVMYFLIAASAIYATPVRHRPKVQRVTVNLTNQGYRPESFRLKKGIPASVTFIRRTKDSCGEVVVLPAYGIRKTLPFNEPLTVTFTPKKTGTFDFTCGMDMLRGQIIVE
ncbi:MAG: cupredoxin domain-containing protein [Acidobacteriota bacterium]